MTDDGKPSIGLTLGCSATGESDLSPKDLTGVVVADPEKFILRRNPRNTNLYQFGITYPRIVFNDNKSPCTYAAQVGNLEELKKAHENGHPVDWSALSTAIIYNHVDCLQYLHEHGKISLDSTSYSILAAYEDSLDCLKYLHEHGCPLGSTVMAAAAACKNTDCMLYLYEHGCPWDTITCETAAEHGSLNCLRFAHEHGCPWDKNTCSYAAKYDNLDCLQYAHEHGCPWDKYTCSGAAKYDNLNCLQYAHEHGCPWDETICFIASGWSSLDCLQYARENGCPN